MFGNGVCFVVVDPSAFCPLDEFRRLMDETVAYIKSSRPAPGFEEVLVPGELEFRTLRRRQKDGIPVDAATLEAMREHGARLGVDVDGLLTPEGARMSNVQPLRLGMFVMPIHDPAKPLAQCIDEDLELAVQCEGFGFHDFWVGEHHSSSVENIVMPEIFLGKVLGLTERIRIGPAPVCLQYHHPAHVAGRLAFLDHLSHGRLNVCFGPGAIPTDMEVFGAHASETGGACRRIDRHDHAIVDGRGADRHRRTVLEREDERQGEPQSSASDISTDHSSGRTRRSMSRASAARRLG